MTVSELDLKGDNFDQETMEVCASSCADIVLVGLGIQP